MKIFFLVLGGASLLGGLIGGELMGNGFSFLGCAIGGIGTAAILLGLGAYFDAQDRKRSPSLTPEIRQVFDRMITGKDSPTEAEVTEAKKQILQNHKH